MPDTTIKNIGTNLLVHAILSEAEKKRKEAVEKIQTLKQEVGLIADTQKYKVPVNTKTT